MIDISKTPVCILAGGSSERFGTDKALAMLGAKTLLEHLLDRLELQTKGPILISANATAQFTDFKLPTLTDGNWSGAGPLAGLHAALQWASHEGLTQIATVAVDLPFLPTDFLSSLEAVGAPTFAASSDQWHPVNGLWSTSQLAELRSFLQSGKRSAHGWAEACNATPTLFHNEAHSIDPFLNINTAANLEEAERMLGRSM